MLILSKTYRTLGTTKNTLLQSILHIWAKEVPDRLDERKLTTRVRPKVSLVKEIICLAEQAFEKPRNWFSEPNKRLKGEKPIDLMQKGIHGLNLVRDRLQERIEVAT